VAHLLRWFQSASPWSGARISLLAVFCVNDVISVFWSANPKLNAEPRMNLLPPWQKPSDKKKILFLIANLIRQVGMWFYPAYDSNTEVGNLCPVWFTHCERCHHLWSTLSMAILRVYANYLRYIDNPNAIITPVYITVKHWMSSSQILVNAEQWTNKLMASQWFRVVDFAIKHWFGVVDIVNSISHTMHSLTVLVWWKWVIISGCPANDFPAWFRDDDLIFVLVVRNFWSYC